MFGQRKPHSRRTLRASNTVHAVDEVSNKRHRRDGAQLLHEAAELVTRSPRNRRLRRRWTLRDEAVPIRTHTHGLFDSDVGFGDLYGCSTRVRPGEGGHARLTPLMMVTVTFEERVGRAAASLRSGAGNGHRKSRPVISTRQAHGRSTQQP